MHIPSIILTLNKPILIISHKEASGFKCKCPPLFLVQRERAKEHRRKLIKLLQGIQCMPYACFNELFMYRVHNFFIKEISLVVLLDVESNRMTLLQVLCREVDFVLEIVRVNFRAHTDDLQGLHFLLNLRYLIFLIDFAMFHNAAYGGLPVLYLDKIAIDLSRLTESLFDSHHSDHASVLADESNLAVIDSFVNQAFRFFPLVLRKVEVPVCLSRCTC
mmetsp:Transcript_35736/g.66118  ORF Transcript_35736/g.66118 Transcript_35736/m.66118 type:complete len:218 (-) Transcript_35736:152-805(-)